MNRRDFGYLVGGLAGLVSLISLPACLWSTVYKRINKYVPLALLAFDRIVEILAEHGIPIAPGFTDSVNAVKAALADIQSAILAFEEAHGEQTAIGAIRMALEIAQRTLEDFWRKLNIPDPGLGGTIKALIGTILSTLSGFLEQLPKAPVPAVPHAVANEFGNTPKLRTMAEFRDEFNGVLRRTGESKYAI